MKKFMMAAVAAIALLGNAVSANAYQGGWYYDNNVGGREILYLGDNSDDTYRGFSGTAEMCGRRGVPYARMRSILSDGHPEQITWWISHDCGHYVRVCVQNWMGRSACSTYIDRGW